MAMQAAMFAGFAFEQITEPVPQDTPFLLEVGGTHGKPLAQYV